MVVTYKVEANKRYRITLPAPLKPSEIESWLRLQDLHPTGFEVDLLFRLDAAYVAAMRRHNGQAPALVSMRDSKGIDALFKSIAPPKVKPKPTRIPKA